MDCLKKTEVLSKIIITLNNFLVEILKPQL